MKCRVRCQILFGLVALLQFGHAFRKQLEQDHALTLQMKVENLIEKILQVIRDYYHQIRTELKCIPDEIPDTIIGTLKRAIDCVDHNERNYDNGRITSNAHKKNFIKCFSEAKTEVEETITSIDPNLDYCPENMTEKTYQINVTTTFTKTFHINIKNGLEVMKKKVHLGNEEQICIFNQGEHFSGKPNQAVPDNRPKNDSSDAADSDTNENKGKDFYSKGHHGKGHESKGNHGKGHEFIGSPNKGHEPKDYYSFGEEEEDFLGINENPASAQEENDSSNADKNVYQPVEQISDDNGHASKEHHGKGQESRERPANDHKPNEHHGKGPESKERPDTEHKPKEHHGKGPESKERPDNEHKPKEHHGKGPESKERPDNEHKPKEHHGKGPESKENLTQGHDSKEHESKVRPSEGHESKEGLIQGHVSKEHPGKGHQPKEHHGKDQKSKENHTENLLGITDSGDEYGGNDSTNEDDQEIDDENDNGESESDNPLKEFPGYGGASNDDDDDDYENENDLPNADEYDEESDFSGADEEENGGPDSGQDNDEESETEGHHAAGPDSQGFHGKGHESEESYDEGPGSAQEPDIYEETQVNDDDNSNEDDYADDSDDDADNDADDDEDINVLQEGKQNIINSIAHLTPHDMETKNKTKDKNPFSGQRPIIHDSGNDDVGTDQEKFFFPDTTAKSKFTTPPESKLAMESPTQKPFDQDFYADPDAEPEDSNYGNEYYDASEKEKNLAENPDKSLNQKLGQSKPAAPVAQRIQIKPKNQIKHKPKKPPQNSEKHKITLPKTWPKKPQPRLAAQSITSLSQSFLQSDF